MKMRISELSTKPALLITWKSMSSGNMQYPKVDDGSFDDGDDGEYSMDNAKGLLARGGEQTQRWRRCSPSLYRKSLQLRREPMLPLQRQTFLSVGNWNSRKMVENCELTLAMLYISKENF